MTKWQHVLRSSWRVFMPAYLIAGVMIAFLVVLQVPPTIVEEHGVVEVENHQHRQHPQPVYVVASLGHALPPAHR